MFIYFFQAGEILWACLCQAVCTCGFCTCCLLSNSGELCFVGVLGSNGSFIPFERLLYFDCMRTHIKITWQWKSTSTAESIACFVVTSRVCTFLKHFSRHCFLVERKSGQIGTLHILFKVFSGILLKLRNNTFRLVVIRWSNSWFLLSTSKQLGQEIYLDQNLDQHSM